MYIACCVSLSFLVEGQEVILRSRHSWHNVARFPEKFNRFSQGGYHLEVIEIENGIYCIFFIKRTFLLTWNFMDCLKTTFLFPIIVYYEYGGGGWGHLRWKSKERINSKNFLFAFWINKTFICSVSSLFSLARVVTTSLHKVSPLAKSCSEYSSSSRMTKLL